MGKKEKAKKAHSQGTSTPTALRQEQSQCLGQFLKSLPNNARQELMSFKVSDLLVLAKRADKEKLNGEKLDMLNESAPQRTEEGKKAWKLPYGWVPGEEDSLELQLYETINCMKTHSTAKIWQLAGQDPVFDPQSFRVEMQKTLTPDAQKLLDSILDDETTNSAGDLMRARICDTVEEVLDAWSHAHAQEGDSASKENSHKKEHEHEEDSALKEKKAGLMKIILRVLHYVHTESQILYAALQRRMYKATKELNEEVLGESYLNWDQAELTFDAFKNLGIPKLENLASWAISELEQMTTEHCWTKYAKESRKDIVSLKKLSTAGECAVFNFEPSELAPQNGPSHGSTSLLNMANTDKVLVEWKSEILSASEKARIHAQTKLGKTEPSSTLARLDLQAALQHQICLGEDWNAACFISDIVAGNRDRAAQCFQKYCANLSSNWIMALSALMDPKSIVTTDALYLLERDVYLRQADLISAKLMDTRHSHALENHKLGYRPVKVDCEFNLITAKDWKESRRNYHTRKSEMRMTVEQAKRELDEAQDRQDAAFALLTSWKEHMSCLLEINTQGTPDTGSPEKPSDRTRFTKYLDLLFQNQHLFQPISLAEEAWIIDRFTTCRNEIKRLFEEGRLVVRLLALEVAHLACYDSSAEVIKQLVVPLLQERLQRFNTFANIDAQHPQSQSEQVPSKTPETLEVAVSASEEDGNQAMDEALPLDTKDSQTDSASHLKTNGLPQACNTPEKDRPNVELQRQVTGDATDQTEQNGKGHWTEQQSRPRKVKTPKQPASAGEQSTPVIATSVLSAVTPRPGTQSGALNGSLAQVQAAAKPVRSGRPGKTDLRQDAREEVSPRAPVGQIESRLPANIPGTDYPEYPASQPNFSKPERPRAPGYNTATTT